MSFMYAGVCLPIVPSGPWICCAFSPPGDIHLPDLVFTLVPFVLPPPFECMFDVVLPVTKAPCCVRLRGMRAVALKRTSVVPV